MMIVFLVILFSLIIGICIYNRKWNSPYKLIMLFGKKGSGKTTTEAKYMIKYASKGYNIYTDIEGIQVPGVNIIKLSDLKDHWPMSNSCVLLDEVGLSMNNREFKTFDKGLREFFKLQRHAKCVVIINSQGFDCDKSVRLLVDQFYFVQRIGPLCINRPIKQIQKPNDMTSPNNDSPIIETYHWGFILDWKFTWIPKYAKMFSSFALPDRPFIEDRFLMEGHLPSTKKEARQFLRRLNKRKR